MEKTNRLLIVLLSIICLSSLSTYFLFINKNDNRLNAIEDYKIGKILSEECKGDETQIGNENGCVVETITFIEAINKQELND